MFCRFATFLFVLLAVSLGLAAQPAATELPASADRTEFDYATGEIVLVLRGHARLADGLALLTADEIRYNSATETATATGHVILTRGPQRLLADKLIYERRAATFSAESIRVGSYPFYVTGVSATGSLKEISVTTATVTYREPGRWQPTVQSSRILYAPGKNLRSENSSFGLGSAQPFPLPRFQQNLNEPLVSYLTFTGGYRKFLGAYAEGGLRIPLAPGVKVGGDVGLYTARGLMAGPSVSYIGEDDGRDLHGYFRSGFIRDHGDKLTDILGRPVPQDRGYVEWQHSQRLTEDLTLAGQINWWRDSEVVRDFRPRSFFPVQTPDTFIESVYTGHNYFVSLFTRLRPNSFDYVQERLPEVRFDLMPSALGLGIYQRANASAVALRERPPAGVGPRLESDGVDAYYALTRPFTPREWLSVTPTAGARVTHYSNTTGATVPGGYTRVLGEIGFDAALRASATYDYKNPRWKIDGLRHLVTPKVSYRYIPQGDIGRRFIPAIDRREPLTSYLRPLGLGDQRSIDDLHATDTLRLGLDNTIQTRDSTYGSRDLLVFNTAVDFRFHREPGERDFSAVHTEIAFMPAPWFQLDVYESFTPQTGTLQELNSGITIRDGDAWSLRFATNFLRRESEDYRIEGRRHLNESYDVLARFQYDARARRLNEQAYGLVHNLNNTWLIEYVVSIYSGRRRENGFGFNVQVEAHNF
ncbi:MAG: LPS assembly protein LptD [Undibacterium sp.]|nr:LPS assembly protein LptD [Opitutaceae bacterium]